MEIGLSEAAEALRDFFGPRLDANRSDGPDRMVDALVERFHISKGEAKKIVDDLIKADSVRFYPGGGPGAVLPDVIQEGTVVTDRSGTGMAAGTGGIANGSNGYWQFK